MKNTSAQSEYNKSISSFGKFFIDEQSPATEISTPHGKPRRREMSASQLSSNTATYDASSSFQRIMDWNDSDDVELNTSSNSLNSFRRVFQRRNSNGCLQVRDDDGEVSLSSSSTHSLRRRRSEGCLHLNDNVITAPVSPLTPSTPGKRSKKVIRVAISPRSKPVMSPGEQTAATEATTPSPTTKSKMRIKVSDKDLTKMGTSALELQRWLQSSLSSSGRFDYDVDLSKESNVSPNELDDGEMQWTESSRQTRATLDAVLSPGRRARSSPLSSRSRWEDTDTDMAVVLPSRRGRGRSRSFSPSPRLRRSSRSLSPTSSRRSLAIRVAAAGATESQLESLGRGDLAGRELDDLRLQQCLKQVGISEDQLKQLEAMGLTVTEKREKG